MTRDLQRAAGLVAALAHRELYHVHIATSAAVDFSAQLDVMFRAEIGHLTLIPGQSYEGARAIEVRRPAPSTGPIRRGPMRVKEALVYAAADHRECLDAFTPGPHGDYVSRLSAFAGDPGTVEEFDAVAAMAMPVIGEAARPDWGRIGSPVHHAAHEFAHWVHRLVLQNKNRVLRHLDALFIVDDWQTGSLIPDFQVSIGTEAGGAGHVCKGSPDHPVRKMLEAAAKGPYEVLIFPCTIFRAAALILHTLADEAARPDVGFLRVEDIRRRHQDLTESELQNVRNQLQVWRDSHEDECFRGEEDPNTGRRRWGYPVAKVDDVAEGQRAKRKS